MCATLGQLDDVVNLLRRGDSTARLATLAQRVGSDEAATHALPRPAVPYLHDWVALLAFVPLGFLHGVLFAEASVGKPGTAVVRAGSLGSIGH